MHLRRARASAGSRFTGLIKVSFVITGQCTVAAADFAAYARGTSLAQDLGAWGQEKDRILVCVGGWRWRRRNRARSANSPRGVGALIMRRSDRVSYDRLGTCTRESGGRVGSMVM